VTVRVDVRFGMRSPRGRRILLAGAAAVPIVIVASVPASADPSIEVSTHTSVVVTHLDLHGGRGYLRIDARTVDSASSATVRLPGGGGAWAVTASNECSSTSVADGSVAISCGIPKAGRYIWSVPVSRTGGAVTALWGSTNVTYSGPPDSTGFSSGTLDTFPIIDLDAPLTPAATAIAGITAEVRAVETDTETLSGGVSSATIAMTLNVPSGTSAYAADIELPIQPGLAWASTSDKPNHSDRWRCEWGLVAPTSDRQTLTCFSFDPSLGAVPLTRGVNTLVIHLLTIGHLPGSSTGLVFLRGSRDAAPVPVDTFPVAYAS